MSSGEATGSMKINPVVIHRTFADKIKRKHQVTPDEIREVFDNSPHFRRLEKGHVAGEDIYGAYGRTYGGRYLSVFFVYKPNRNALVISARNMDENERRRYAKT